jgi:hypothetical protein
VYWDAAGLNTLHPPSDRHLESLEAWERLVREGIEKEVPAEVRAVVTAPSRDEGGHKRVREHYVREVYAPAAALAPLKQKRAELARALKKVEDEAPTTMVSQEMTEPRKAHVLVRGNFQTPGEAVERSVPAVLPPMPSDAPKNRLGLALWLVSKEHPLTARVTVNRFWKQVFGTGIVKTLGDFGSQGERPTHPELLDWLAVEFVESGWDVKGMMKRIATSATYRQSARVNTAYAQMDPGNRLLWASPRYRLSAEEVRDNALAVAGLLNRKVGGPSVRPYQPKDFYKGKYDAWTWEASKGEDLYRRGMYTFWRRTSLYPTFSMFDAPSREVCTADRARTNTPLQALATMNDPVFVEAARVYAQRVMKQVQDNVDIKLVYAFRCALSRPPTDGELAVLKETYAAQQALYAADKSAAESLVSIGDSPRPADLDVKELAAWTAVANVILNLDETITRE